MRTALFVITSDPTLDTRAAEGLRIAAGVLAWKQVAVRVYLDESVARALSGPGDIPADEGLFGQCLPMLGTETHPVLVAESQVKAMQETGLEAVFAGTNLRALAALAAQSDWVMRF